MREGTKYIIFSSKDIQTRRVAFIVLCVCVCVACVSVCECVLHTRQGCHTSKSKPTGQIRETSAVCAHPGASPTVPVTRAVAPTPRYDFHAGMQIRL